jgi:hypothetical protein
MTPIAIFLPNAVTIRDIVHTGTLAELLRIPGAAIEIYTQNPDLPEFAALRDTGRVTLRPMADYRPGRLETFVRQIYPLLFYDVFVHLQKQFRGSRARRLVARAITGVRKAVGTRRAIALSGRLLSAMARRNARPAIVGRPALVIGTRSLVASLEFPMLCEAAAKGIPIVTAASSWDNFTTKGYLPLPVAKTVVWNRKMADELHDIFGVPRDDVVIAGYPRLPLLENTGRFTDAASYLRALGLGQYRRFVLYSASYGELTRADGAGAPREFELIRMVSERLVPTLPADTCVIVRLHPFSRADDERFFDGMDRVHAFVPGRSDRYVERVMSEEDENHLAAQLQFSECIVSMASTMSIDALSIGRPILNVAFEPDGRGDAICKFYEFNHFADLVRIAGLPLATDVDQVLAFVHRCIAGDHATGIDSAAFAAFYVPPFSREYPRILRETVEGVLADAGR